MQAGHNGTNLTAPEVAPEENDTKNSLGGCPVGVSIEVKKGRKLSDPSQYRPEKGTSRHSVGLNPLQSV